MSSQSTFPAQSRPSQARPVPGANQTVKDRMAVTQPEATFGSVGLCDDDAGEFSSVHDARAKLECEKKVAASAMVQSQLVRPQLLGREHRSLVPLARWMRSSKTMLLLISALCIGLFVSSILLAV